MLSVFAVIGGAIGVMLAHTLLAVLLRIIRHLPSPPPDPEWAGRLRTRCRADLMASRRHGLRSEPGGGFWDRILAPALVAGLCVIYFAAVVVNALRLRGPF